MTVDEMTDTLTRLGIEIVGDRGYEIQAHCPAHLQRTGKQDRNPSWYINADSGAHNCFSCGWKGSLYSLIAYVTGVDYEKATEWLGSTDSLISRFQRVIREEQPKIEEPTYITESMLSAFTEPPKDALLSRGLRPASALICELKWDERNKNWIIPIRDPITHKLLGWQEKGYDHRYFNNKPAGIKKSETLFGYMQYGGGDVLVVESPLDVVRLLSLGYAGFATYGATVSRAQFNLIRGADRIIFAMDNDEAGRASSKALLQMCEEFNTEAWFFNYGTVDAKDVGGMSLDEIKSGIENAKHMVKGERVL
jgi:DNA primase